MQIEEIKSLIKSMVSELMQKEDLDEATTTGDIEGYNTPFAFSGGEKEDKEKNNAPPPPQPKHKQMPTPTPGVWRWALVGGSGQAWWEQCKNKAYTQLQGTPPLKAVGFDGTSTGLASTLPVNNHERAPQHQFSNTLPQPPPPNTTNSNSTQQHTSPRRWVGKGLWGKGGQ